MVRASITALIFLIGDIGIFVNQQLQKLVLSGVGEVRDEPEALIAIAALVPHHVLIQHGLDLDAETGVTVEDILRAEQASLLSRVPVKLNGVDMVTLGNPRILQQGTKNVEEHDGSGTVVIGARGAAGATVVADNGVEVRPGDDGLEADLSGNRDNDRRLRPGLMLDESGRR